MATTCSDRLTDFKDNNHDLPDFRMSLTGGDLGLQQGYRASKSKLVRQADRVTGQHTLVTWVPHAPCAITQ